jgi:DNA-binding winged helix-turn-helix (wHTH) protein
MSGENPKKFRLGKYELDGGRFLLLREDVPVPLSRKRFKVLLYLVEERDRLVTRQELLERFWEGHEVYEENLTKCVSEIRKALDDQKKPHRIIATTPAVGYRYIGPVEEVVLPVPVGGFEIEKLRGVKIVIEEDVPDLPPAHRGKLPAGLPARPGVRASYKLAIALLFIVLAGLAFAAFKLWGKLRSGRNASTATVLRTMQVTSWTGLDLYPSFSPDGSAIAFSSDRQSAEFRTGLVTGWKADRLSLETPRRCLVDSRTGRGCEATN